MSEPVPVKIEIKPTNRGLYVGDFQDYNGDLCSIQDSSLATTDTIWLGMNRGTHTRDGCLARMLLTRAHVQALIPLLQRFVDYGSLNPINEEVEEVEGE